MPSVNVSPNTSKPTHSFALSWAGETMGFNLENGEKSLVEGGLTPSPTMFQSGQTSWVEGRGHARHTKLNMGFYDSGSMWTMTPEFAHTAPQWGLQSGLLNDDFYCPQSRNVSWQALLGTSLYVSSTFAASASYNATRIYAWIRAVGSPGTLTAALYSDTSSHPNAALQTATVDTTTITDVLSVWSLFTIPSQALTSTTNYWVVLYGASTDSATNHWEVGIDASPATFSKISSDGSSWSANQTYKMYFRVAEVVTTAIVYPFQYYGALFAVMKYKGGSVSRLWINGDLGKASAGTSNTITKTASGGISWATNQLAGAYLRIVSGPGAGTDGVSIVSHTSGTTPVFTVSPNFTVTPTSASIFIVYATPYWKEITSPSSGLGVVVSAPAVGGQTVYFPQSATAMRRMYFNTSTGAYVWAADGANLADFVRTLNGQVVASYQATGKQQAKFANFVAQGSNLSFVGATDIGSLDYSVNSLCDYSNFIFALKDDGLFNVINGRSTRVNYGGEGMPSNLNGRVSLAHQGSLYFSFLHSLEQMTNATITDVGWWKDEGMPAGRQGPAIALTNFLSWLFVGIDAGPGATANSSVLCGVRTSATTIGWHEIFRAPMDTNRVSGLAMQPNENTRPRMWIFVENEAYFIDFPQNAINPLRDSGMVYMHEGYLTTSTIDMDKINFSKLFKEILAQTKNLSTTTRISIDYQVDNNIGSTTWLPLDGTHNLAISPLQTLAINRGDVNMIRFRLRFRSETATIPPVLCALQLNGYEVSPSKYYWNATCLVAHKVNEFDPDALVAFLKDAANNARIMLAHSTRTTLDGKWVYVTQPTIEPVARNKQTKSWSGIVKFIIKEA